jgi:Pyruvate/2-oxoacid:ferredoxin oxidoreductase delta subunit
MGHSNHIKDEYQALLKRFDSTQVSMPEPQDPTAWKGWREVLEIVYTPEEALFASKMPVRPAGLHKVAERMGMSPEKAKTILDGMANKGIVMDLVNPRSGNTKYMLSPPVIGMFEFTFMRAHDMFPKKKLAQAMNSYMYDDPGFAMAVFGEETVLGRAMVREEHLAEEVRPDILQWERATELIENADQIGVTLCYCRHKKEHVGEACDAPKEICISLDGGADFLIRRKFARKSERSEAMELMHQAKELNLVQIADNVSNKPSYICNCCGCCCGQLSAINKYDLSAVNPSGFQPEIDNDDCNGCSRCSRACPITAISMEGVRVTGKAKNDLRPVVNLDRCIGCGVCVANCTKKKCMKMVRREEQPYVSRDAVERTIRMCLERGRLPHLLFDEGENRGARFLNRAIQILQKLPVSERVLASKQLHSRFLKRALGDMPNPQG